MKLLEEILPQNWYSCEDVRQQDGISVAQKDVSDQDLATQAIAVSRNNSIVSFCFFVTFVDISLDLSFSHIIKKHRLAI